MRVCALRWCGGGGGGGRGGASGTLQGCAWGMGTSAGALPVGGGPHSNGECRRRRDVPAPRVRATNTADMAQRTVLADEPTL